ncbi:MAG: DUF2723 domain-containing protein [Bacteroidales bacterium]|nr:DUF2723 domain-containing protein [Candidatus Cryptobacteroides equifaecalis]
MDNKTFKLWHRLGAAVAFVASAITYLLTIEPTASYWDCGEFIASSYKLEVGHPPGNPVFQIIARLFTMLGDNMHAAVLVNAMSAICSALTIMLLYLTIVWFVKRTLVRGAQYSTGQVISIVGSGLVGSLAYCFSDTFWFSAVEGEVYAMSSLFTAVVFWAMTMWYDHADEPHSNKWIVLISFLMGLSIGVHLLNLLAVPALVFMFYYRTREDRPFSFKEILGIALVGCVILGLLVFVFIPYLPKLAAYSDLFFVNVLGLPYNTGAAFFMVVVLGLCFWGLFRTMKSGKVFLNTALLCVTTLLVGFSVFSIDIIRSCAKTPTNEYQPDNAFTLVRYLSREQYGSTPLVYGQYYGAPYDVKSEKYWAPLDGKYKKVEGPLDADYHASGKMLFPRMWATSPDGSYEKFYESYNSGKGRKVSGAKYRKPTMWDNLNFFMDYQLNWMYWRYFMWNFVGRQNQVHSPSPGDIFHGNWESGIKPIDNLLLGDQEDAPACLADDPGKNHYFFLPLLLGILGLCFQFEKDRRGCFLNFMMFFMTGIAIVLYLNQPPFQVRERDYAYAGSFYFFSVWIGIAVAAISNWITSATKGRYETAISGAVCAACLAVPVEMGAQNWDDHDRSERRTAVEMAYNYLNSVGENGILITHGDNDTFPLWYAQEVEECRPDLRIVNTSLLGTDWHIDQMTWASNKSAPLPLSVPHRMYLYGTNEYVPIVARKEVDVMNIHDVMTLFKHPQVKISASDGTKVDYLPARRISVPVNKQNALKAGIINEADMASVPDSIILSISPDKNYLSKPELFMLDLLDGYEWDRPIHLLNKGGDLDMGIKDYLQFVGYSYKFTPFRNKITADDLDKVDTDLLYRNMTEVYKWDAISNERYFIDYQNMYTHLGVNSIRSMFNNCARAFMAEGQNDRALEMLDSCQTIMARYPLDAIPVGFAGNDYVIADMIQNYFKLSQNDKARELARAFGEELLTTARFYLEFYEWGKSDFEMAANYIYYVGDILTRNGEKELADILTDTLEKMIDVAVN